MGLLQDPRKSLDQIEWYLNHREMETFPGAFELAAGNLCRQTLEQILFVLCFFSRMPANNYLRRDRSIRTAGELIRALDKVDTKSGKSYWALVRQCGPRLRKFARYPRVLRSWQRTLNEPSHFSATFRRLDEQWIRHFLGRLTPWIDDKDKYLAAVAVNELFSQGRIKATLSADEENTPGIRWKTVVGPMNFERDENGNLTLRGPKHPFVVISDNEVPRGPWPQRPVFAQHTAGIHLEMGFETRNGDPVDITSMERAVQSIGRTRWHRGALTRRFRKLGIELVWRRP